MKTLAAVAMAMFAAAPAFAQSTVKLDFEQTAGYVTSIQEFYNGGSNSLGQTGPSLGVSFTGAAAALSNDELGPYFSNAPSPIGVMFALDTTATMNVANGFVGRLTFSYSSRDNALDAVNIYSGLNGSGTLLASASLFGNENIGCSNTTPYCRFDLTSVKFAGLAKSATFGGNAPNVLFDDVTISVVPEPGTYLMLASGLALVAFAKRRREV